MIFASFLILLAIQLNIFIHAERYTIDNAPELSRSDNIQFFYLEAPFPYNAPSNIREAAGVSFNKYGISHAGLGIWDTSDDFKMSIEFICDDYVGSLLPTVNLAEKSLTWKNQGSIIVTEPLVESDWLNSRLLSTTSSTAYTQLIDYLKSNRKSYENYQPVSYIYADPNSSFYYDSNLQTENGRVGEIKIQATESFDFVNTLIKQLDSYGVDLGTFLNIYAVSFDYVTNVNQEPEIIEWDGQQSNSNNKANSKKPNKKNKIGNLDTNNLIFTTETVSYNVPDDILNFYNDLSNCYSASLSTTLSNEEGASFFFQDIKNCYSTKPYAYIFKTPNSVYKVNNLINDPSLTISTPYFGQYVYELPEGEKSAKEKLQPIDYVTIVFVLLGAIAGSIYLLFKFLGKKERRRLSFESDRIAQKAVDSLAEEDIEGRAYFNYKSSQNKWDRQDSPSNSTISSPSPTTSNPLISPKSPSNSIQSFDQIEN